jgi:hypothetical protein
VQPFAWSQCNVGTNLDQHRKDPVRPVEPARQTRPAGEIADDLAEFRVGRALQFSPGSSVRAGATAGYEQSLNVGEARPRPLLAQFALAKLPRNYRLNLLLVEARGSRSVYRPVQSSIESFASEQEAHMDGRRELEKLMRLDR